MDFNYLELVELGISLGLVTGIVVPFAGKCFHFVFKSLKGLI